MPLLQIVTFAKNGKGAIRTKTPILVPGFLTILKEPYKVYANLGKDEYDNLFFTVAYHAGTDDVKNLPFLPTRSIKSFLYQGIMPFDIDGADKSRWADYAFIFAKHLKTTSEKLVVIDSGNGLHIYLLLLEAIRSASYFEDNRKYYKALLELISRDLVAMNLPHAHNGVPNTLDPSVFDAARIMRLPGSYNVKEGKPRVECVRLQVPDDHEAAKCKFDVRELSGLPELEEKNVSPEDLKRHYPTPDFPEIVKECLFVSTMVADPKKVHEPLFFPLSSLLAAMPPNSKLETGETAEELAEKIFNGAVESASLSKHTFDQKWDQSSKYGAPKCSTVDQSWGECRKCPHFGKVRTPLALKSKDHLSSEVNGFWRLNKDGNPTLPNYEELTIAYKKDHSFMVTPSSRVFTYTGGFYRETEDLLVESYLERKMNPTYPIMNAHRREFLSKVKATGVKDQLNSEYLFNESILGHLNCRNGVVDIMKGKLKEHSPEFGFQYILPYDYIPGESSEMFLDWLALITQNRTDLMDTLLDLMAYSMWPSYDDHAFTYLVGTGKNGKSTYIQIIRALCGEVNCASVSMQQLAGNKFAPANLEGKLVNLSEESSGSGYGAGISAEEMNVIKNLSSGGNMQAERKGIQGYEFKNKAKLIFSANETPRFREQTVAVKRRLIVVPFDYEIARVDPKVGSSLVAEVPKILSMLVRRIQENISRNNGAFMVSRNGSDLESARDKFLDKGSTSIEWANDHLVSSFDLDEDTHVEVMEAYGQYTGWCKENGYQMPETRRVFGTKIKSSILTKSITKSEVMSIGNKSVRVFRKTRWKKEEEKV